MTAKSEPDNNSETPNPATDPAVPYHELTGSFGRQRIVA
jgi:hypothetical protein